MSLTKATVFYHIDEDYRQEIVVDAKGVLGEIVFPRLEPKTVDVLDLRLPLDSMPTFLKDSFEFFNSPTQVKSFSDKSFEPQYNQEIEAVLKNKLKAKEVIVFDHTVRDESSAERAPARHAHIDYSEKSALEKIEQYIPESERALWLSGEFSIVNTWRPTQEKVQSAPLGFIIPKTVSSSDLIVIDLVYPTRRGQVLGALHNKNHEWVYLNEMAPDELVVFNMYNNKGLKPVVHSALDLDKQVYKPIRRSVESRVLIRF